MFEPLNLGLVCALFSRKSECISLFSDSSTVHSSLGFSPDWPSAIFVLRSAARLWFVEVVESGRKSEDTKCDKNKNKHESLHPTCGQLYKAPHNEPQPVKPRHAPHVKVYGVCEGAGCTRKQW